MILHDYMVRQHSRTQAARRRHARRRQIQALARHAGVGLMYVAVAALYGAAIVGFCMP